jgi:hypothetical protein
VAADKKGRPRAQLRAIEAGALRGQRWSSFAGGDVAEYHSVVVAVTDCPPRPPVAVDSSMVNNRQWSPMKLEKLAHLKLGLLAPKFRVRKVLGVARHVFVMHRV